MRKSEYKVFERKYEIFDDGVWLIETIKETEEEMIDEFIEIKGLAKLVMFPVFLLKGRKDVER
jgi:hypothetical protein